MRMVRRGIAADGNLAAGHLEVDANPQQIALMVARMLALDDDAASHDPIEEPFEFLGPFAYARTATAPKVPYAER